MSRSAQEPSYYEIALTHRQVVIAFVILLGCLLASFFSGIWLGRGERELVAGGERPTVIGDDGVEEVVDDLEHFNFFSGSRGDDAAGTRQPDRKEPRVAGRTPAARGAAQLAAKPQVRERQPPAAKAPPPKKDSTPPSATEAPPPAATSTDKAAGSLKGAATAENLVIQVLSSRDQAKAREILGRLVDSGFGAHLSPVQVGTQTMYRVRVGPFGDRESAEKTAARIRREHKLETWITH